MKLLEKIPFFGGNGIRGQEQQGRVRLLGKLGKVNSFEVSDFNELVKAAATEMEVRVDNKSVFLGDEFARDVDKENLLERHLSYRVEVTEGEVTATGEEDDMLEESTTFKVILRVQPHEAIEINGPHDISSHYKEALKDGFNERTGKNLTFQDIVED